jgi:predicted glycogen debranching enzyme
VDATLWFVHAVHTYCEASENNKFIKSIYPKLVEIIDWHVRGTRHRIHVEDDGLLFAGEPGVQLTWMDAKVGDWVVTPRIGKPVEIQALWFNALKIMETFATTQKKKSDQERFHGMAVTAEESFGKQFWNENKQCLYDVVNDDQRDGSVRPNQIFALSLPWPLVTGEKAAKALETIEKNLLTPFGLRTLSNKDANYKGVYSGGVMERDSAYHQGTVWPWLLGAYIDAHFRVRGITPESIAHAQQTLAPLEGILQATTPGQLPEVFSGDRPHTAGGCFAQAWSVAEVLRSVVKVRAMKVEHLQSAIPRRV